MKRPEPFFHEQLVDEQPSFSTTHTRYHLVTDQRTALGSSRTENPADSAAQPFGGLRK